MIRTATDARTSSPNTSPIARVTASISADGPLTVNELAARLEVAPTTVSLMVGDLARYSVLERREDPADRRHRIVAIDPARRPAIHAWLARGADAWRTALRPLTPAQRRLVVDTLLAYEAAVGSTEDDG